MRKLSKTLYPLATARRERYGTLKTPLTCLGGVKLLDRSVCFWTAWRSHYGCGKGLRAKCIGGNENGIFGVNNDFGTDEKREVIGMLMPHLDYLLVSGSYDVIAYLSGKLENEFGPNVLE